MGISDTQKNVLYDNVELQIGPKDIVYLTVDRGSGKIVVLRAIIKDLAEEIARLSDVEIDPDRPLIDTVGRIVEEGLKLLSEVGLNDLILT